MNFYTLNRNSVYELKPCHPERAINSQYFHELQHSLHERVFAVATEIYGKEGSFFEARQRPECLHVLCTLKLSKRWLQYHLELRL